MKFIYDIGFHYNDFQVTVVVQKFTQSSMRFRAKEIEILTHIVNFGIGQAFPNCLGSAFS